MTFSFSLWHHPGLSNTQGGVFALFFFLYFCFFCLLMMLNSCGFSLDFVMALAAACFVFLAWLCYGQVLLLDQTTNGTFLYYRPRLLPSAEKRSGVYEWGVKMR